MAKAEVPKTSYLRKVFYFTHLTGLSAGAIFPLIAAPVIGSQTLSFGFILICLLMGLAVGASLYYFVRITLKKQLRQHLDMLRPLAGNVLVGAETVESLQNAVENSVTQVTTLVHRLLATVDDLVPHYYSLAESSGFLSDRAQDGLSAARRTRTDVQAMEEKQQEVLNKLQLLSDRSQDEAAISRELSASLEEMAGAMDHSTAKFLETSTSVDEMASSVREVAAQAEDIARSVEGTARDLDAIGESLEKIRSGASSSAQAVGAVSRDAENGLQVVRTSMQEMDRIEQESRKATEAMKRLSHQTGEVVKIIEVIKELVSDTELLAFNAAIIAAKAGEEGKGFSVVAEEIRDLADRTTTSAQDIHRIVKAIGGDTREVMDAVEATGHRITKGKELSTAAGDALRKIVESSTQAASSSEYISSLTGKESERARALLNDARHSLGSVKAIARAMQEQQTAIARIQEGVSQMKGAADQIARGMEEQVRANREFDKGLAEREQQIRAIHEATSFQIDTAQRVFNHFASSEQRLKGNADKAAIITREIAELEILTRRLKELVTIFARSEDPLSCDRLEAAPQSI